ncbi:class A beta-lactamase [Marinitenerispora sediminis]|uniref:Beta-lactamase n=1 Tax=Marinitenerispora sediminis TaxID=1931232 RepID=A0A368T609_9ACTN|nr:class A beta-lactamase [Marinitenerispora sediminis]RCV51722.1 class A beta-lactamase [Marinitenerispora sediminis]RCV55105.1 class A beta-lactamase [Marinitenerispora sediminis]RCV59080.1 class A beta-lactamase [Marinitenerispora sediminis]
MPSILTRRAALAAAAALALTPLAGCATAETAAPVAGASASGAAPDTGYEAAFAQLESEYDARLGVYAIDTGTEEVVAYRPDDRFAYCSTHKAFSAAAVLDQNSFEELDEVVRYTEADLVPHSPVTEQHVDTGMPLIDLVDAAVLQSDNTAANLLFAELGGPSGLQAALRETGDDVTHVDRVYPDLAEATPGDIRDTSTPQAMAATLRAYTLGDALRPEKREVLVDMLRRNPMSGELIRAGVPEGWVVGDKTGAGGYGTRNDIAVVWPPDDAPIVIAIMSSRDAEDAQYDNALIAESAAVVVDALA